MIYFIVLLLIGGFIPDFISGENFPSDIKKCEKGDGKCITSTISEIFKNKIQGDQGLNLKSLSPMFIEKMYIEQGGKSPVNIVLFINNGTLTGLQTARCVKVNGFNEIAGSHEILLKSKYLTLIGGYSIDGKVLILPIRGQGQANITTTNVLIKIKFDGKPVIKNDKTYMDVSNLKLDVQIKRLYIQLTNLFNGDKALGDNMNLFLNENWEDIYGELKEPVQNAFLSVFEKIIHDVFMSHPYNELFA